jgi:nucleoside-diphosphate-sugar epimerase
MVMNRLVDRAEEIAGIKGKRNYKRDAPKGVRGRSSDNTLVKSKFGWEPSVPLRTGLERTYAWIFDQMKNGESKDAVNQH